MSKMGAPVGGQDRAALEAFVATCDTSVPGIEASDLNDGDILARTRENVNPNGLFQFVYIPDDGSEHVTSDWVDQEHKKKLTRVWVDGVKNAIISRAQAKITAAKEAAEEARAKSVRDEQFRGEPMEQGNSPSIPERSVAGGSAPERQKAVYKVATTAVQTSPSDPQSYVEDQLDIARERLRAAEQAQQDITREVLTARRDYEKWKALVCALDGVGDGVLRRPEISANTNGVYSSGPVQQSAGDGSDVYGRIGTGGQYDGGTSRIISGCQFTDREQIAQSRANDYNPVWTA
jgi:hypothetical protein